jgi:hypothetical protein
MNIFFTSCVCVCVFFFFYFFRNLRHSPRQAVCPVRGHDAAGCEGHAHVPRRAVHRGGSPGQRPLRRLRRAALVPPSRPVRHEKQAPPLLLLLLLPLWLINAAAAAGVVLQVPCQCAVATHEGDVGVQRRAAVGADHGVVREASVCWASEASVELGWVDFRGWV